MWRVLRRLLPGLRRKQAAETSLETLREAEDRYRIVAETASDAIITIDEESKILFINLAAERMFGYPLAEMSGQQLTMLMPEYLRHLHRAGIERYIETGKKHISWEAIELPGLHKSGKEISLELSFGEFTRNGKRFFTGIMRDITDRKRVEESLRFIVQASEMLALSLDYEATLANVARLAVPQLADWCVVHMVGEDGKSHQLAAAHADETKLELLRELNRRYPMGLNTTHSYPLVIETGQPELIPEISDSMLADVARDEEHLKLLRALGLKSTLCVPLTARGRTLGAITFATAESGRVYDSSDLALAGDLARRAATAVDNARLYQEAHRANLSKDDFLATLSHELRTPLTPIIGWVHMMRGGMLKSADLDYGLAVVEKNSQSLTRLINDLLDMSAILSGKMRIERLPVPLKAAIEESIETIRPQAEARRIKLETRLCEDGQVLVGGDRTRLVQTFWNILANAVKFSDDGSRVQVTYEADEREARLIIEDEGQGIEPEFLPSVFERFRQADSSKTRTHGGLGIGLALVKSFVEAHGGSVKAESAGTGRGSRFTIRLPRLTVPIEGKAPKASETETRHATGDISVLVVEDAPDTLEMLDKTLRARGYIVTQCESAAEALDAARTATFDIIISDIGMPEIDGYELIRRLRQLPHLSAVPAIALTGYASERDINQALDAGYDAHIAKPVDPADLAAQMEELLRGRKMEEG
jgi:PAS domain S-box-containing protein